VELVGRGEVPDAVADEEAHIPFVATMGQAAPDFVASDLTNTTASVRLRNCLGRPVLMVFYNPASQTSEELLRFARGVHTRFNGGVTVFGLSVTDDANTARKQRAELDLGFPILSGSGLRISYAVETTPKFILIDATGVLRGAYLGWGHETAAEVMTEIRQCLQRR
jgi:peroxiredoxin